MKHRKLSELFRMRDTLAKPIRKNPEERQSENLGDTLREPVSEAIRPARMAATDARNRIGCRLALKLPDEDAVSSLASAMTF
jgi:hypothetical protein